MVLVRIGSKFGSRGEVCCARHYLLVTLFGQSSCFQRYLHFLDVEAAENKSDFALHYNVCK